MDETSKNRTKKKFSGQFVKKPSKTEKSTPVTLQFFEIPFHIPIFLPMFAPSLKTNSMATAVNVLSNFAVDRAFTMDTVKEIRINDHITNHRGITYEEAEPIHDMIVTSFNVGQRVVLDFADVEWVTAGFLYQAVGKLYEDYTCDQLKSMLEFSHLSPSVAVSVRRQEEQMKFYMADPELYDKIMEDAIYG